MSAFHQMVHDLEGGRAELELNDALTEIVTAVQETRKGGELVFRIKIKPNGEHGVIIASEIKAKIPEPPRSETMFFATSVGHLMRNDPRQQDLPLRQVPMGHGAPLRVLDGVVLEEGVNAYEQ